MCTALRQGRAKQLRDLRAKLTEVQGKIGQKRYRAVQEVQARAETQLRRSPVGKLMRVQAYAEAGQVRLRWWVDREALQQAMQSDGRYLLVTNDPSLSPQRMLQLYRAKDGLEKRFEVAKQDLRVRPIYLHRDDRIEAMLLINMIALLAYSLLEREVQRQGLGYTARQVREKLESLAVIETHCWDGSVLYRLTPVNEEQYELLVALASILAELTIPRFRPAVPAGPRPQMHWQFPPGMECLALPTTR
jgi:transposase